MPKYEDGFKYSINHVLGFKEDGTKDYSDIIAVGLLIPVFLIGFWVVFIFSKIFMLILVIIIIIISILILFNMRNYKIRILIEAIAYEKKGGRQVIPDAYRFKLFKFESNHNMEIKNRISNLDMSDVKFESPSNYIFKKKTPQQPPQP